MTRADELKPVRRLVVGGYRSGMAWKEEELVIEVYARRLVIRPKGTRSGGPQEKSVSPGQLYQRLVLADLAAKQAEKQKARKKGRRR